MDRMLNSKREKESIYEIYRACRLCGGGAGYKMPIIQNIVDLEDSDVELKQKIRDCVQIEVHQDDKMPPLICELCVDKVNDFYEFLEMCRQTNKRTRLRLGLPPQSLPRGAPDAGDCILGLTEPVFVNDDSDGEPLAKHKKLNKSNVKREPVVRIKIENLQNERLSRHVAKRPPTPPRTTRHSRSKDDDVTPVNSKDKSKPTKMAPKSILKKDNNVKTDLSTASSPRSKRSRDREPVKLDTPSKKVKINVTPPSHSPSKLKPSSKLSPKSSPRLQPKSKLLRSTRSPPVVPKRPPSPPKDNFVCTICGQQNKSSQARGNHMRLHSAGFTNAKLACNPCGTWFSTPEESASHQRNHKSKNIPYNCRRCQADFKRLAEFDQHIQNNECLPFAEVPDLKCEVCWHLFPTNNLLSQHKCLGEDHRPGGKCSKCSRGYALLKNLKKHESTCTAKKKGEFIIDKELLSKLKPIQIRVARCDPLLTNVKQEHYDVSSVSYDYGLDDNCYYPYISSFRIKSEFPGMVDIQDEIKREFCSQDYVHWDSEDSEDDEEVSCNAILNPTPKKRSVESLAALTLKIIFSKRFLGKVPKKKRKLKVEKVFDSLVSEHDEVRMDIGSIIDNLGDDDNDSSHVCDRFNDTFNVTNLGRGVSNVSSDRDILNDNDTVRDSNNVDENDTVNDSINDKDNDSINDRVNDSMNVDEKNTVNDSLNDSVKDSMNDGVNDNDSINNDVNDSSSQLSNNDIDAKPDIISSNDNCVQDLNKDESSLSEITNSIDNKNNDNDMNNDKVLTNNTIDSLLENLNQDSNSQSVLENDFSKSNDSISSNNLNKNNKNLSEGDSTSSNNIFDKELLSRDSMAPGILFGNNENSIVNDSKDFDGVTKSTVSVDNLDTKSLNLESNTAISNDNLEFPVRKNAENNDSIYVNDSRYENRSLLDEIDAQINDSNMNSKDSDTNNDKIVLDDLLSKSSDSKIGLGSIEDYSFDS